MGEKNNCILRYRNWPRKILLQFEIFLQCILSTKGECQYWTVEIEKGVRRKRRLGIRGVSLIVVVQLDSRLLVTPVKRMGANNSLYWSELPTLFLPPPSFSPFHVNIGIGNMSVCIFVCTYRITSGNISRYLVLYLSLFLFTILLSLLPPFSILTPSSLLSFSFISYSPSIAFYHYPLFFSFTSYFGILLFIKII